MRKNIKKLLALGLSIALGVTMLTACGSSQKTESDSTAAQTANAGGAKVLTCGCKMNGGGVYDTAEDIKTTCDCMS